MCVISDIGSNSIILLLKISSGACPYRSPFGQLLVVIIIDREVHGCFKEVCDVGTEFCHLELELFATRRSVLTDWPFYTVTTM